MGVLDDAIREHIELQRKHGANPSLLERQEQEALSPARREAPAQPPEGQAEDEAEPAEETPEPTEQAPEPVAEAAEPEDFPEPASPDIPEFAVPPPSSVVDEPADDEPFVPADPPPGEVAESEDVLEETPEFLQETPEHDRLWFEQKPPRDFDFDDEDR